ncbi:hypothetical protein E8F11_13875 [Pseudomonas sp. BN417]|uniref:hypothetical protein n=1 Tax=Pseudomonas sp. BN417 TaxID=2567890 RepID=UPI0024542009|nr:hypothetical protein [Pseudomonas sp. BN417]MDH4556241.1 hypothetical protein [Pseudomonas sp. BN417]
MRVILLLIAGLILTGCAANTTEERPAAPLAIPSDSRTQLIVNFKAGNHVFRNAYWDQFKSLWHAAIQSEASTYRYTVTEQVGPITTTSAPGLLLVIKVDDFRYVTESEFESDSEAEHAWVDARVIYLDAQTAKEYGERSYNTSSTAWEGIASATTDVQVRAFAKGILNDIRSANTISEPSQIAPNISAARATDHALTRRQQLDQLDREGLSYEEYQRRYREIVAQ